MCPWREGEDSPLQLAVLRCKSCMADGALIAGMLPSRHVQGCQKLITPALAPAILPACTFACSASSSGPRRSCSWIRW